MTQLINNSGISICMVGTPESTRFFESAMQLARRSVGLQYTTMGYDAYFQQFCKVMFSYQYTQKRTEITDGILEWLYEHSAGVTSVVVALIHDAQEIAILNDKEALNLESLADLRTTDSDIADDSISIADLVAKAKDENMDIVQLLKAHMPVVEVAV